MPIRSIPTQLTANPKRSTSQLSVTKEPVRLCQIPLSPMIKTLGLTQGKLDQGEEGFYGRALRIFACSSKENRLIAFEAYQTKLQECLKIGAIFERLCEYLPDQELIAKTISLSFTYYGMRHRYSRSIGKPAVHNLFAKNIELFLKDMRLSGPYQFMLSIAESNYMRTDLKALSFHPFCDVEYKTRISKILQTNDVDLLHLVPDKLLLLFRNNKGENCAQIAAKNGFLECLKHLHSIKSNLLFSLTQDSSNIAHIAADNGHLGVLKWINSTVPDLLDHLDNNDQNIAHITFLDFEPNGLGKDAYDDFVETTLWIQDNRQKLLFQEDNLGKTPIDYALECPDAKTRDWAEQKHCAHQAKRNLPPSNETGPISKKAKTLDDR